MPGRRLGLMLAAVTLAVICAALSPASALAEWTTLTPPCSYSATLTLGSDPALGCFYGFDVNMRAGETVVATLTTSPDVKNVEFETGLDGGGYNLLSYEATPNVWVLQFSAMWTHPIGILLYTSTPGTFTVDVGDVPAGAFHLGTMHAPKRARPHKSFHVWTTLSDYDGLAVPVDFKVERWLKGRWRPYTTLYAYSFIRDTRPWFGYGADARLRRGTFRIRARFKEPAHPVARYSGWKRVSVY